MKQQFLDALTQADRAWLEATFARNRARFGDLRMEEGEQVDGSGDSPAADDAGQAGDSAGEAPKVGPDGFPTDLPWRQMQPEHQVAYWQHQSKRHERIAKSTQVELSAAAAKAAQFDALDEASKTEQQREVDRLTKELADAKAERETAKKTFGTQLVETRLSAAADKKGMTPAALKTLAGDLTRFLGEDGMDPEAVDTFLAALPDKPVDAEKKIRHDLGGGTRTSAKVTGLAAGADLWASRHPKKQPSA